MSRRLMKINAQERRRFPLSVHSSKRYLVQADGTPFLPLGDTPWSAVAQLTDAEIDTYIDNRAAKHFTALLIQAPVIEYTVDGSENNVDGVAPFTVMSPWNWTLNNTYWNRVDRLVNRAFDKGMLVVINPAYTGYNGASTTDGCYAELQAASAGTLQSYGAALANRYNKGNVAWSMGGDWSGTSGERDKQWNIITGIRSVRTTDLVTAHAESSQEAWLHWNGYTGFNLNWIYPYETEAIPTYAYSESANAYGRSGPVPFIMFEGKYEGSTGGTASMMRRQFYGALLAGACGHFFGNNPVWHFESPQWAESYSGTWESNLDSTGAAEMQYGRDLLMAYQWWKLEPKTDASLVSSALSSGATRVIPARASDGTFAMVYVPSSQTVTVVMSALTPSSVRVRLFDPTTGSFSTASGSPFANSGTQGIVTGGERVIVLDAA